MKESTLFQYRYIDQIITCSVYAVSLANKQEIKTEIKFKNIIDKFQELPFFNYNVIVRVNINETEQKDIIKFYNEQYLKQVKIYFKQ